MDEETKKLEEKKEEEVVETEAEPKAEEPQVEEPAKEEAMEEPTPNPEAETPAAEEGEPENPNPVSEPQPEPQEEQVKTFTQEQVNELVGKARAEGRRKGYEQARSEAFAKYGVDNDDQLDDLFANGTRYGELNRRYVDSGNSLKEAQTELALVKSQILPERQGDVKAILAASGLDVTEENITSLLPTHPEWRAQAMPSVQGATPAPAPEIPQPTERTPIKELGVEPNVQRQSEDDEREKAMKMFGLGKK